MKRREALAFGLLALAFAAVSVPMLARSPQNPDGAELILTAVQGGVLHPPGYPVQAWVDRAVVRLFPDSPAVALSALSLVSFTGALFLLGLALRRLGLGLAGACLGTLCFALYPPAWALAVQPEKYALLFLLLSLYACGCLGRRLSPGALGALFGLVFAQHVIGLVALPLVLARARAGRWRARQAATFLGAAALVSAGLYLTLLGLTVPGAWPDWGKLGSLSEVLAHFARRDIGFFTIDPTPRPGIRGIEVARDGLVHAFSLGLLLVPLGAWAAWQRLRDARMLAWALSAAGAIAFVAIVHTGGYREIAITWLERYTVLPLFFLSAAFGLGWDEAQRRLPRAAGRPLAAALLLLAALGLGLHGHRAADASSDATLDLYSRALGRLLPDRAVYFGGNDLEYFYGALSGRRRRFPLYGEYEWYRTRAMPLLEPRMSYAFPFLAGHFQFDNVTRALAAGFPVYTTTLELVEGPGRHPVRRGLFWALEPRAPVEEAKEAWKAALTLCSSLQELGFDPPREGHPYSRYLWQQFALAFEDTSVELERAHERARTDKAADVAVALLHQGPASQVRKACAALTMSSTETTAQEPREPERARQQAAERREPPGPPEEASEPAARPAQARAAARVTVRRPVRRPACGPRPGLPASSRSAQDAVCASRPPAP